MSWPIIYLIVLTCDICFFFQELYDFGCRNIIVNGLPPIGCLPIQMTAKSPLLRTCINKENIDAQIYNQKLEHLLIQLQTHLPRSKILYVDSYSFVSDLINNPQQYGKYFFQFINLKSSFFVMSLRSML